MPPNPPDWFGSSQEISPFFCDDEDYWAMIERDEVTVKEDFGLPTIVSPKQR